MRKILTTIITLLFSVNVALPVMAGAIPEIQSEMAIVMDARTGIVLFERMKDEQAFPASVTKVMTALLAIENSGGNFKKRVPFSYAAVHSIMPGSSHIAMDEDESLSLDEALYGLMLASANEVANAIAESVSGDMNAFARRMNARAAGLGAVNTNFTNAHGLPEDEHYTTAYDMALIMREAVKHPKFVELISTRSYEIMPTERQSDIRLVNNTNRMILPHTSYYDERVVGGKTGYTDAARHTLTTYGKDGDKELIIVTLRGEIGDPYRDTSALLDYGFEQFEEIKVFNPADYKGSVDVTQIINGVRESLGNAVIEPLIGSSNPHKLRHLLPKQAAQYITVETTLPDRTTAPVSAGDIIGELRIYCNKALLETIPLVATNSIASRESSQVRDPEHTGSEYNEPIKSEPIKLALLAGLCILTLMSLLIIIIIRRRKKKLRIRIQL